MVKIRLARRGSKKRPFYHVVVTDSENPRDGRFFEQIGTYDPNKPMTEASVDLARVDHWVGVGAQLTDTVRHLVRTSRASGEAAASEAASA